MTAPLRVLILALAAACGCVAVFGPGTAQADEGSQLAAIAAADGPSGVASQIASTPQGDTALVVHALQLQDNYQYEVGSHSVGDVYRYSGGAWQPIAHVDFGADSPGPIKESPPSLVGLTGATDFLVHLESATTPLAALVTDAGGSWRVASFVADGHSQTILSYPSISGHEITSGVNDCTPNCAQGKIVTTTWIYSSASGYFVPALPAPPRGPCQAGSHKVGPFTVTSGCFRKSGNKYIAQGSISVDGVSVSGGAGATITVAPLSKSITSSGSVSVSLGGIRVFSGKISWSLKGSFSIAKKGQVKIKGLAISGSFQLSPSSSGMQVTAFAAITSHFTANLSLLVDNNGSLDVKKLRLDLSSLPFKQLVLKDATLTYQQTSKGDQWVGNVQLQLPAKLPAIQGTITILNGQLTEVDANVTGINKPIGEIVFLQSLGLKLKFSPHFDAFGSVALTGGPKLPLVNGAAVGLNASLEANFGSPVVLTAKGNILVASKVTLAQAQAVWTVPDKLAISGSASFSLAGASATFKGNGLVDQKGFLFFGQGSLSVPGHSHVQAFGYLSEKGVTSCGEFTAGPLNVLLGFGYHWGDGLPSLWFDSCGALAFKSAAAPKARDAAGGLTFHVPSGQRQTVFSATGAGAAPAYSLRSPSGAVISSAGPQDGALDRGGYLWLQDPARNSTDVVLARPTPGTWTLIPTPGSAPIVNTGVALSAPPIKIHARVQRVGRRERLTWNATEVPGGTLVFSELGARTSTTILRTVRNRGSLTFTPNVDGTSGVRRIQAVYELDGLPQATFTGASFRPPPPARPRRPGRLSLSHRGQRLVVRWSGVSGASGYQVIVSDSAGRRDFFSLTSRQHAVAVSPVLAPDRLSVSVQAVTSLTLTGPAARARLVLRAPRTSTPRSRKKK